MWLITIIKQVNLQKKKKLSLNIILCGLHTLYNDSTNNIIDLKIFMNTYRGLIKKWKIKRDVEQKEVFIR
jgi:uridine kinase